MEWVFDGCVVFEGRGTVVVAESQRVFVRAVEGTMVSTVCEVWTQGGGRDMGGARAAFWVPSSHLQSHHNPGGEGESGQGGGGQGGGNGQGGGDGQAGDGQGEDCGWLYVVFGLGAMARYLLRVCPGARPSEDNADGGGDGDEDHGVEDVDDEEEEDGWYVTADLDEDMGFVDLDGGEKGRPHCAAYLAEEGVAAVGTSRGWLLMVDLRHGVVAERRVGKTEVAAVVSGGAGLVGVGGTLTDIQWWRAVREPNSSSCLLTLESKVIVPFSAEIHGLALGGPNNRLLGVATSGGLGIWSLESSSWVCLPRKGELISVLTVVASPCGTWFLGGVANGSVIVASTLPSTVHESVVGILGPDFCLDAEITSLVLLHLPDAQDVVHVLSSDPTLFRILPLPGPIYYRPEHAHAFPASVARTAHFVIWLKQQADRRAWVSHQLGIPDPGPDPEGGWPSGRLFLTDLPMEILFSILEYTCGVSIDVPPSPIWLRASTGLPPTIPPSTDGQ